MTSLVILRHGQSIWNEAGIFTGWEDVPLSKKGIEEAKMAAHILVKEKFSFDIAFSSILGRATKTLDIIMKEMNNGISPSIVKETWELNERHYGALQGLKKDQAREKYGAEQLRLWRRSYSTPIPQYDEAFKNNRSSIYKQDIYNKVPSDKWPLGESLEECSNRVLPYFKREISPLFEEKNVIIVSHHNVIRAIIKSIENIADEDIINLPDVPTSNPLLYEDIKKDYRFKRKRYLLPLPQKV